VSDRLDCPDCGGTGEQRYGPINVRCLFCRGQGYVGDDNEPAEDRAGTRSDERVPLWQQTGAADRAAELPGCAVCLGAGVVVNLGDIERPSTLIEAPCPRCRGMAKAE
jgi:DnaJ-class molecular chaperone